MHDRGLVNYGEPETCVRARREGHAGQKERIAGSSVGAANEGDEGEREAATRAADRQ